MHGDKQPAVTTLIRDEQQRSVLLRWIFIGLLFALAVKDIVVKATEWLDATQNRGALLSLDWVALAPLTHLGLAVIVGATAWVLWSRAMAPANAQPLRTVFSWPFVALLFELALVACVLILVSKVELVHVQTIIEDPASVRLDFHESMPARTRQAEIGIGTPDAGDEALWVLATFLIFLAWDFVGDFITRARRDGLAWCVGLAPSFICAVIAWIIWQAVDREGFPAVAVVCADVALITLFMFYHALKRVEAQALAHLVKPTPQPDHAVAS